MNRVCTDVLAFEGDGRIVHSVGDYDYYLDKKKRSTDAAAGRRAESVAKKPAVRLREPPKPGKPRKLSFKEARELEGMEALILEREAEVVRIEALFATPDFHRTHGTQTNALVAELAAAKESVAKLYSRWQELEAIRAETEKR